MVIMLYSWYYYNFSIDIYMLVAASVKWFDLKLGSFKLCIRTSNAINYMFILQ